MKNMVLVVEDEKPISDLICMNLQAAGYLTIPVYDGKNVELQLEEENEFDLALVDVMLPGKDGFDLMEVFKSHGVPVIYLTAKSDVTSKVYGLRLGAEDYIVKPFEIMELLVRVEKVLERNGKRREKINIGCVTIDLAGHQVYREGTLVPLKPMEYDLLVFLAQNKNVAFSRDQLLNRIWGSEFYGETRTVDVHIAQIRKKLNLEHEIRTISKLGYRLEDNI